MKVFIIEDEELAVKKIIGCLNQVAPAAEVMGTADSIVSSVAWLEQQQPDLILMDIELADGQSFEIFNRVTVTCPVIFTTSYDEFALKAFKVHSVDYLLKPIQKDELKAAIEKYQQHFSGAEEINKLDLLVNELRERLHAKEYRKRFLVKFAQKLVSVEVSDIAYFFSDGRIIFFKTRDNKKYVVDYTLEDLETMLDPARFFRISRSHYISIDCIEQVDDFFGNRLILQLRPSSEKDALVSRERVAAFKAWMGK